MMVPDHFAFKKLMLCKHLMAFTDRYILPPTANWMNRPLGSSSGMVNTIFLQHNPNSPLWEYALGTRGRDLIHWAICRLHTNAGQPG
jgi:hypothetical protein